MNSSPLSAGAVDMTSAKLPGACRECAIKQLEIVLLAGEARGLFLRLQGHFLELLEIFLLALLRLHMRVVSPDEGPLPPSLKQNIEKIAARNALKNTHSMPEL